MDHQTTYKSICVVSYEGVLLLKTTHQHGHGCVPLQGTLSTTTRTNRFTLPCSLWGWVQPWSPTPPFAGFVPGWDLGAHSRVCIGSPSTNRWRSIFRTRPSGGDLPSTHPVCTHPEWESTSFTSLRRAHLWVQRPPQRASCPPAADRLQRLVQVGPGRSKVGWAGRLCKKKSHGFYNGVWQCMT